MRIVALAILGAAAGISAILGWEHLWSMLRQAAGFALGGWLLGMLGVALLAGRRKQQSPKRMAAGLVLAAIGLAVLAMPHDGQGLLTGLRVGYAGCLVAVMPHTFRLYRSRLAKGTETALERFSKEVL